MSATLIAPQSTDVSVPEPLLEITVRAHLKRIDNPAWDPDVYEAYRTPEGWLLTNKHLPIMPDDTWLVTDDKVVLRLVDYTDSSNLFMWDDTEIYAY